MSKDPDLSSDGIQRANLLSKMLEQIEIDAIYCTPYKRTRQTVEAVSKSKNVPITEYSTSVTAAETIASLQKMYQEKTILVAGHSNTIPGMLGAIDSTFDAKPIDEDEFDNLFIVTFANGKAKIIHLKYGNPRR